MKTVYTRPLWSIVLALSVPVVAASLITGCAGSRPVPPQPAASVHVPDTAADLRIAESALEAGDTQLAVSLFEKLMKTDPRSDTAQLGLGDAMYQTGDLARAGILYARVAAAVPDDPRAQLGLARVALRERRLDEAVSRYRKLVATHPDNPLVAEGLGTALDLQGKHTEAQAVYRAALQPHPEAEGLKADLGLSLILSGDARAGANVLLDIAILPDAPLQARGNLALAYGLLGNSEAARRILTADMPTDSVEDNLRLYQNLRERFMAQAGDGPAQARAVQGGHVTSSGALR
jgi:Flp pilus assembly protein TadD